MELHAGCKRETNANPFDRRFLRSCCCVVVAFVVARVQIPLEGCLRSRDSSSLVFLVSVSSGPGGAQVDLMACSALLSSSLDGGRDVRPILAHSAPTQVYGATLGT